MFPSFRDKRDSRMRFPMGRTLAPIELVVNTTGNRPLASDGFRISMSAPSLEQGQLRRYAAEHHAVVLEAVEVCRRRSLSQ